MWVGGLVRRLHHSPGGSSMRRFTNSRRLAANVSFFALAAALPAIASPAAAQAQPTTNSQQQSQPGSQRGDSANPNATNPQSDAQAQTGQPPAPGSDAAI